MATAFTRTREQLAALILGKLGVLEADGTAKPDDATLVYEAIDLRLKEMHRLGIFWRKVTTLPVNFTITANVASAATGVTDGLFPLSLYVSINSVDTPVRIIDPIEYAKIPEKTQSGDPVVALRDGANFIFWPVSTADLTAKLVYERIADDTAESSAPDVEVSMLLSLKNLVAYDLADHFGLNDGKIARFAQEAMMAEKNIRYLSATRIDYAPVSVDGDGHSGYGSSNKTDWYTG